MIAIKTSGSGPQPAAKEAAEASRRRKLVISVIMGSVIVHVAALVVFGIWIVAKHYKQPEAVFHVVKKIKIPVQTPEHRMNMARHEAIAPKPTFNERLVSTRPLDFALPDLPEVDMDQMLPLDPSELVSDQIAGLVGAAGLGNGQGSGLMGGGGTGSGMSFFRIKDDARSVAIMIDVSASMFGRTGDYDYSSRKKLREGKEQSFQIVREQAIKLIDSLSVNSRFGVIHWSGSARLWKPQLVPATDANKASAKEHIQSKIDVNSAPPTGGRPGGTRHDYALEAVFKLGPEAAFMLTDGNATRSLGRGKMEVIPDKDIYEIIEQAKKDYPSLPRIHTIYYMTGKDKREEEKMLRGISRKTKGKFKKERAAAKKTGAR